MYIYIYIHIHTALFLIKEHTSQQKKCGKGPVLIGNSLVLPDSSPFTWLDRVLAWPFADFVTVPTR